jgi:hypothetical protein
VKLNLLMNGRLLNLENMYFFRAILLVIGFLKFFFLLYLFFLFPFFLIEWETWFTCGIIFLKISRSFFFMTLVTVNCRQLVNYLLYFLSKVMPMLISEKLIILLIFMNFRHVLRPVSYTFRSCCLIFGAHETYFSLFFDTMSPIGKLLIILSLVVLLCLNYTWVSVIQIHFSI